jgi:hypothetical protein
MITEDIEIGIKISPTLYLNMGEHIGEAPFDVNEIINIEQTDNGTFVYVAEPDESSRIVANKYFVNNSFEKVREALDDAHYYKKEGLNRIKELLN